MNSAGGTKIVTEPLVINGERVDVKDIVRVARRYAAVSISPEALQRVRCSREMLEKLVDEGAVVYGITTGFGRFSDVTISREDAIELQKNLISSHAAAIGNPLPEEAVRAALLLRLNALARGNSGVRPLLVEHLAEVLNSGVTPVIPEQGSLGASGD